MTAPDALIALRDETTDLIRSRPDILDFCGPPPVEADYLPRAANPRPVQALIEQITPDGPTGPLVRAIQAASPHLHWNATYSADEVGADFLNRYGWFDIIGPKGPWLWSDARVMAAFWDQGLDYAKHWHDAEELYVPLYGRAEFWKASTGAREEGPGSSIFHASNEKHAAVMRTAPLLTLAIWRGSDLVVAPTIEDVSGKTVTISEARAL